MISYSSSSLEWLLAGRVAGPAIILAMSYAFFIERFLNPAKKKRKKMVIMQKDKEKDLLTLLREEESHLKRKDFLNKLVQIMDYLWEKKSIYKRLTSEITLDEMKKTLLNSTFQFSSMYRSWIPKPNKPGHLRAITQPNKADIIVMDALSQLLKIVFDDLFVPQSHGFRKGRGPITFFLEFQSWGRVDRLKQSDVVKCFDNIDHGLLISALQSDLGEENLAFLDLILRFLRTIIWDSKDY